MLLCDRDIQRLHFQDRIAIKPFDGEQLGPSSYDIRLGGMIIEYQSDHIDYIDPRRTDELPTKEHFIPRGGCFTLPPKSFVLAESIEYLEFPKNIAGRMEGKSSLGRLGLLVHSTAGFFDPGFRGICTLEMYNFNEVPILLWRGMLIAQMAFYQMGREAANPYSGKYQDQEGVTPSKYHLNESEGKAQRHLNEQGRVRPGKTEPLS